MNFATILLLPLAAGNPPIAIPPPIQTLAGCYPPARPGKPDPCLPHGPPAPLLAAKILTPAGVRTTLQPGSAESKAYSEPIVVGFRPGYYYRLELSNLPEHPGLSLFPEIEVRASLVPRPGMNYMDYPAAIVFTAEDLQRAAAGALVTKVIYLENPDFAVPVQTTPDRPIEEAALSEAEAVRVALEKGRPVMIVRLGDRQPDPARLQASTVTGTVLFPGERKLGAPSAQPCLPFCGVMLFDPILGPKFPYEECLPDGGDTGPRLGIGPDGRPGGLNPTDVAVEYTKGDKRRITTSNRVCLCVPRFAVQRAEIVPGGVRVALQLAADAQAYAGSSMLARNAAQAVFDRLKPVALDTKLRLQAQVGVEGRHLLIGPPIKPMAVARLQNVQVVAAYVAPEETTNFNDFIVTKTIEPSTGVKIGDVVTITIRYMNHTRLPVSEVVVSDNLTARLEYVPGSSESDRPADVTTEVNEVGSSVVRFDLPGVLQSGQGGIVKFKARVR